MTGYSTVATNLKPVTFALQELKNSVDALQAIVQPSPSGQVKPYVVQQNVIFNNNNRTAMASSGNTVGFAFTGDGSIITGVRLYVNGRTNSNSNTVRYGLKLFPSGSGGNLPLDQYDTTEPLAWSDVVNLALDTPDHTLVNFPFSGTNQYQTVAGQRYFIALYLPDTFVDTLQFAISTPPVGTSDIGHFATWQGSVWGSVGLFTMWCQVLGV
ncbi:MAG: hypothetical protein FWE56_03490 [Candidatus Bathyarchaeota archaeon]|nr:hypothetical protein [Candidatus Termiticorpusculum sp.]